MAHQHTEGCCRTGQSIALVGALNRLAEPGIKKADLEPLIAEVPCGAETNRPGTDYSNGLAQLRASGITSE